MRWPIALQLLLDRVEKHPAVVEMIGAEQLYHAPDIRKYRIPSLNYQVLDFGESEVFETLLIQWGVVAPVTLLPRLLSRVRRLTTSDHPVLLEGNVGTVDEPVIERLEVRMLSENQGGRMHRQPAIGVQHASFDVQYEPLRERYYLRAD